MKIIRNTDQTSRPEMEKLVQWLVVTMINSSQVYGKKTKTKQKYCKRFYGCCTCVHFLYIWIPSSLITIDQIQIYRPRDLLIEFRYVLLDLDLSSPLLSSPAEIIHEQTPQTYICIFKKGKKGGGGGGGEHLLVYLRLIYDIYDTIVLQN